MGIGGRGGAGEDTGRLYLPTDLRTWITPNALASLVLNIVQNVEERRVRSFESAIRAKVLPARVMLSVLTYCYAVGSFGSRFVARKVRDDDAINHLCAAHPPEHESIQAFRQQNRGLLEECLERVCMVVWKVKFGDWQRRTTDGTGRRANTAGWRIDSSFYGRVKADVRARLAQAELADSARLVESAIDAVPVASSLAGEHGPIDRNIVKAPT